MLTAYVGFIPNVELSSVTALIPVANICLLMKNLMVFKYNFTLILIVLFSNIIYAFVAVWFLSRIYDSESILFGESFSGIKLFERRKNIEKGSLPTIQESILILIVALLLMVYAGGMMSLSYPLAGVIVPQFFIGVLPILAALYIKADLRQVFAIHKPGARNLIGAVILVIGAASVSLLLSNVLSYFFPENSESLNESYLNMLDGVPFAAALLLIALTPAVCEELLFRGYMFTAFRRKMSLSKAIVCVSVLFAISHMSLIKILPTAILGVALAYAVYVSNSIFTSSLMHFLNNGFSVFLLYYGDNIPLLQDEQAGLPLVVCMVILAVVCIPLGVRLLHRSESVQ